MATDTFTPLETLRGMLSELQAVPQHTIPIESRKHIIGRIKACLVERAGVRSREVGRVPSEASPNAKA